MTSSKIYYAKYSDGSTWCYGYHDGVTWRIFNPCINGWFTWRLSDPISMGIFSPVDYIVVNNFKEKAKC